MDSSRFDLVFASPEEISEVAAVIQEAARWVTTWRAPLWDPELVGEDFVAPFVVAGQVLTARTRDGIAGVVILESVDEVFWPDRAPGEAIYLHKLAVRRAFAGTGLSTILIDHAARLARSLGLRLLRLDCDRPLAAFYERQGFRRIDEIDVAHPQAGPMRVARMERDLAA